MSTLYFGGSFNPIHHAHLICARAVAEACGYQRIRLVPSAQPPHKPGATDLASPADRARMCRLAVAGDPLFDVDEIELNRPGPSYTLDTVRALKSRGETEVHWLIGGDMLASLPKWHAPETLVREARLILMARPGWSIDWSTLPDYLQPLRHQVISAPLIDISATRIRDRIAANLSITYLTPPAVIDYIRTHGLYRKTEPGPGDAGSRCAT